MKFMSILLGEGRKEDLRSKYIKSMDPEVLDWILGINDLQDFNHKYTDFVLRTLNKDSEDLEDDIDSVITMLKYFDKHNSQLEKKDINQYKSTSELFNAIRPIQEKEHQKVMESKVDRIYEDDKFLVIKPLTHAASCKYGSNTKWCTTAQDDQHFKRYTTGGNQLYYVINKSNSTNKNYSKVAIHFGGGGKPTYWDSQDSQMSDREVNVLSYAFPEIIQSIEDDYNKIFKSEIERLLQEVFNQQGETTRKIDNYLKPNTTLTVVVQGFETINDLGKGYAIASLGIVLYPFKASPLLIDSYEVFITFSPDSEKSFKTDVGFSANEPQDDQSFIDMNLENWGFSSKYLIQGEPGRIAESIRNFIASKVLEHVKINPELVKKVVGTSKVFTPTYGYTFGKNKGWVKKLVDYLDSGKVGTKLDFLTDVGYLEKITQDGKTKFKKTKGGFIYNPRDLRGQHASFFAAAKNAGILGYRKVGKDYFFIKGPNFDAFKSGELKAL